MTGIIWLQLIVIVVIGISIVRALMKLPKWIKIGFAIYFTVGISMIVYMTYFHMETLLQWVEFLHLDIDLGSNSNG